LQKKQRWGILGCGGFGKGGPAPERKRVEKLRYMHRNPVRAGLVQEPEQWLWSSYRSYAYQEAGMVKINQWPKAELRQRPAA
jgi:hypothetical protein